MGLFAFTIEMTEDTETKKWVHSFTCAAELESSCEKFEDVPDWQLVEAMSARLHKIEADGGSSDFSLLESREGDASELAAPPPALEMLPYDGVRGMLKPALQKLWDASCACVNDPSPEVRNAFQRLCRPVDMMLLLRVVAENNREDRNVPFRVV